MAFTEIVSTTVTGETVDGAQAINKGGVANSTTIAFGGFQTVSSGGIAKITTIESAGTQFVMCGGAANVIKQQAGGAIYATTSAKITSGTNTRADGHSAFSIVNGVASNFLLENGGGLEVSAGHAANDTVINSSGYQYAWGGKVSNTVINDLGVFYIDGGTASKTIVNYGGNMYLGALEGGGKADLTTINSGGAMYISNGATVTNTTVNAGGNQIVDSKGLASNTIINSGGSMVVSSGGSATGMLTVAGGYVIMDNASSVSGLTTLSYVLATAKISDALVTVNGGILGTGKTVYSLNLNNAASGSFILASGVDLSGMNSKTFSVTDNSQTVNVTVGSSYTFANGDKLSLNFIDAATDLLTATVTAGSTPVVDTAANTWQTAKDIASLDNWVGFGDPADCYKLTMSKAGMLNLSLIGLSGNADLTLLDSQGTVLMSSANLGNVSESINNMALLGGIYYVKVAPAAGVNAASYTLTHTENYVPADTAGNALQLAKDISGGVDNWVGFGDAADYYKLEMSNPKTLTLNMTGLTGDANLTLLDSKGQILKTSANSGLASEAITGILASGTYYVLVAPGTNVNNAAYTLSYTVTDAGGADTTPPSVPIGLTQIVTGNKVVLDWADSTDASGIKRYEIQGDSQPDLDGNPPEDERVFVTASKYNITLPDGPTYWHVRAQDNAGNWSDWSETSSFIVDSALPTVPAGLTVKLDKRTLVLDWADSTDKSGIKQYELRVDEQPDFSSKFVRDIPVSESKFTKTDMEVGTFYAKVRAQDNAGKWSAWSKSASVTVVGTLSVNDSVDDWVGATDVYKLNLATAGTLNLYLEGLSGDANLALFDAKSKQLKISSAKGSTPESITNTVLAKGDYFVKVIPAAKTTDTDYTLRNTFVALPADNAVNTWQEAKLVANDISGGVDNWVGFGDPADCYKLAMSKPGKLTLNLSDLTGDVNLSLLDSKGKVLKTSANKLNASESIAADLAVGTYYVNVAPVKGVNKADYTLTHAENYFPDDKAGNTFALAKQVMASGTVNEWLGFGDNDDYYKFELKTATTATFNLNGMSAGSNVDLYLYDSKFKQIAVSKKTGNAAESITKALAAGTPYYVKATLAAKSANTSYALNFNIDPAAFKSGSLQLFSASSPLTSGSDSALTGSNDPLKKNQGMLAS